jgi:hypothetical protein
LAKPYSEATKERIKNRTDDLLAQLEAAVIRDGGDREVLDAIEVARRELRE